MTSASTLPRTLRRSTRKTAHWLRKKAHYVRRYVSALGWATIAFSAVTLVAFLVWGWTEMVVIAVFGFALVIAAVLVSLGNTRFDAELGLSDLRVNVGDSVDVKVNLSNPGKTPTARARAQVNVGEANEVFAVPALKPGQNKQTTISFTTAARAVLTVGPLRVRKGDPFGLIRHEKTLARPLTLYVHPRIARLNSIDAGVIRDLEGNPTEDIVDDDLSFYGLRDYQSGDDVRNVHWLTTAKTGHLMVRQYQATRKTTTSLCIATNPNEYRSSEEFELGVSAHASIGVQCLEQNRPLSVVAGGTAQPITASPVTFLDSCSAVTPTPNEPVNIAGRAVVASPDASFYVFTVGALRSIDVVKRMMVSVPRSATCVVLRIDTTQHHWIREYSDFTLINVPALESLRPVLEALA